MVFAVEADYASVRGNRKLCDYWQFHCILCSKHMSNTKAITAHMRSKHPAQLQAAIDLDIQRMRQCSFCMTSFNKTHLCPVFLQMAILELRAVTPDDPLHFTCFLCQFVAADRAELKKHLTTLHQFPCHDWTPARDSLEDQATCAHCGSVISPNLILLVPGPGTVTQTLLSIWLLAALIWFWQMLKWNEDWLMIASFAPGSFHKCPIWWVICGNNTVNLLKMVNNIDKFFNNGLRQEAAVVCHVSSNSDQPIRVFSFISWVWFTSMAIHCSIFLWSMMMLPETVWIPKSPSAHISWCMMHWRQGTLNCCYRIRHSETLWPGKPVTLTGPAKEYVLRHHLQSMHPEPQQAIQCLIQMVIHRKGHDHLTTCDWCGVTIVPTHSNNEYDDHLHLAECPVLLHFVTWLLTPLTPLPNGHRAGGRANTDQGCAGDAGGLRGSKRPLSEEAKKEPSMGSTIQEAFDRQRRRSSSKDDAHVMPASAETRERLELSSSAEHLRSFRVDGPGRHDAPDPSSQQPMETTTTESPSLSIPPAVLDVTSDANIDPKGHQSDGVQEGGPLAAVESSKQDCASGFVMALSQMGPQQKDIGIWCERGQHSHEGPWCRP